MADAKEAKKDAPTETKETDSVAPKKTSRLFLTYVGTADRIVDPQTRRTWKPGETQEATDDEATRLQRTDPGKWIARRG